MNNPSKILHQGKSNNSKTAVRRLTALLSAVTMLFSSCAFPAIAGGAEEELRLICGLEEHQHTDACYETVYACGREESEPVTETERVFSHAFELHHHSKEAGCYDEGGGLTCVQMDGDYYHRHNQWCYDDRGNLRCGLEEKEPHVHSDSCYEEVSVLRCGMEEGEEHTHTEECYERKRTLVCGKLEGPVLTSREDFWTEKQTVVEEGHRHSEACGLESNLICGKEEHTHTDACYEKVQTEPETPEAMEPETPAENEATEEPTAPEVKEDTEETENEPAPGTAEENDTPDTPDENETSEEPEAPEEIEEIKEKDATEESEEEAEETEESAEPEENEEPEEPEEIEDTEENEEPEEPEEIEEPEEPEETEESEESQEPEEETEETAEPEETEEAEEPKEATEEIEETEEPGELEQTEEKEETEENQETGKTEDTQETEKTEDEEPAEPEPIAFTRGTFTWQENGATILADYWENAGFPEGTVMQVREIRPDDPEYAVYAGQAEDRVAADEDRIMDFARFFDITFLYQGAEIEPQAPIDVCITFDEVIPESEEEGVHALHFDNENSRAEEIEAETRSLEAAKDVDDAIDTVTFSSDSFSVYGVVGTSSRIKVITADGTAYNIDVSYDPSADIPRGASLEAEELTPDSSDSAVREKYALYRQEAAAALGADDVRLPGLFDIRIVCNGEKVEPAAPVKVKITLDSGLEPDGTLQVVHFPENILESGVTRKEKAEAQEDAQPAPDRVESPSSESKVKTEIITPDVEGNTVTFSAEGFSVYALVYTVDFHYEVNGETFEYSIPGGGCETLTGLVRKLGISGDEKAFVRNTESVVFSDPTLVWIGQADADTTFGALKEENHLAPAYSSELSEDQLAEINAGLVKAGDWALISLAPFRSEETLTVTMKNGDVFTVKVTDANENPTFRLMVHTKDFDGNPISAEKLGSGYTLYCYEVSGSDLNSGTSSPVPVYMDWYGLLGSIASMDKNTRERYRAELTIHQTNQDLGTMRMETEASASNPSYLLFLAGDEKLLQTYSAYMPEAEEWMIYAAVKYNGTEYSILSGSSDNYLTISQGSDGYTIDVNVIHDDSLFMPKVKVKFDASDYMAAGGESPYPVSLVCTSNISAGSPAGLPKHTISGDGIQIITLDGKVSRNRMKSSAQSGYYYPGGVIGAAVLNGDHMDNSWSMEVENADSRIGYNNTIYILAVDENDFVLGYQYQNGAPPVPTSEEMVITFKKRLRYDSVRIDTRELTENEALITESALGEGYDLVYYDAPASLFDRNADNVMYANTYDADRTIAMVSALDPYKKVIHIDSPQQTYELTMNSEATAENPFLVVFAGEKAAEGQDQYTPYSRTSYPSGTTYKEWDSLAMFWYDGTNAYPLNSMQDLTTEGKQLVVTVLHDSTIVTPKLTLKLDASEYTANKTEYDLAEYPVNITVGSDNSLFNYYSATKSIEADGEHVFSFEGVRLSRYYLNKYYNGSTPSMSLYFSLAYEDGHNLPWYLGNPDQIGRYGQSGNYRYTISAGGIDEDGNLLVKKTDNSVGGICKPELLLTPNGVRPGVLFALYAEDNAELEEQDFPVYIKARVTDAWNTAWSSEKVVRIDRENLNKHITILFDEYDPYFTTGGFSERPMSFSMTAYRDENCTELADVWGDGGSISSYYRWYNNYGTNVWRYYGANPLSPDQAEYYGLMMRYNGVSPTIPYNTYTNQTEGMYPAYLKVTAFNQERIIALTENGSGEVVFDKTNVENIYYQDVTWTVWADETCTTIHPGWGIEDQSMQVGWNGEKIMLYYSYEPAVIDITSFAASTITIPVETTIGSQSPGTFFPSWMTAVLHSEEGQFSDVVVTRQLNSEADANFNLEFTPKENEAFNSNGSYALYAVITSEAISVERAEDLDTAGNRAVLKKEWAQALSYDSYSPAIQARLQGDGRLHQGLSELKLVYKPVTVDVQPSLYKVQPDEDPHVYVRTWLYDKTMDDRSMVDLHEITDNSQFTVSFPMLGFAGAWLSTSSVMTESREAIDWNEQMEVLTSENTYFYSDHSEGIVSVRGTLSNSGESVVLKPFESNKAYAQVDVPVKIHLPESGSYRFYNQRTIPDTGNPNEWAFYSLYRIDPDTGDREDLSDRHYYYYSDYSYTAIRLSLLVDYEGIIAEPFVKPILPGTYYLDYGLSYIWNDTYASTTNIEAQWTYETGVKVILTQDGRLTWENGDPVRLDYYYKEVLPDLDVHAKFPEQYDPNLAYDQENEFTPFSFHYELRSADRGNNYYSSGNNRGYDPLFRTTNYNMTVTYQNIREGDLSIGSPSRRYQYVQYLTGNNPDYQGKPVIHWAYSAILDYNIYNGISPSIYIGSGASLQFRNYPDSNVTGYAVGDYYLTYYSGRSEEVRNKWYSVTNLKVHLAENGKLYEFMEDGNYEGQAPYVMQIKYIGEEPDPELTYNELKIKVHTTVKDGVKSEKAFTAGDTFVAMVTEFRNRQMEQRTDYYAIGTAQITSEGTAEMKLTKPDGSPVSLHDDAVYNLSYGTFHNWTGDFSTSSANHSWPYYNNLSNSWTYVYDSDYCHPNTSYPVYFTAKNVDEDGTIKGFVYQSDPNGSSYYAYQSYVGRTSKEGDTDGETLIFENASLILPWETTNPGTISQAAGENPDVYKPISNISSIKDKGNYIIVARNQYDGKWYALCVDEAGGNSVQLEDVHSLEDLEAGYKVDLSGKYQKMIFTANSVSPGSDSVSLKLKSGAKNDNGKSISMKMGASSDDPEPLLSESAGTVIIRGGSEKLFTFSKGNYSWMWYVDELYGWTGFTTISNKYGPKYAGTYGNDYLIYGLKNASRFSAEDYDRHVTTGSNPYGRYSPLGYYAGVSDNHGYFNKYMVDVDPGYLVSSYFNKLQASNPNYPGAGSSVFYILSDDVEEVEPEEPTNQYTLVKTFGDFVQTFSGAGGTQANSMLLVYTAPDGREYAMESEKLYEVMSKAGSSGYRTVTTVADHLLIPNNNSGTSSNFSIEAAEVKEDGSYVFATSYAFRKSRQNNTDDRNYMTMSGGSGTSAWTKNDDASHGENLVYVLHPSTDVFSQADWDTVQSYTLSVVRNGVTQWLGVAETDDGNGGTTLQMTTVASEGQAVTFRVYTDRLTRYYASAYGTGLYKYYKVNSITDINAGDEILIVYDDNGTKRIVGRPFEDSGRHHANGTYYSSYSITPAVQVLNAASTLDTRDPDSVDVDSKYRYRLGTTEYVKKPYAYFDSGDSGIIWAQGIAANAIGIAKKESKTQRKYESVSPLGDMGTYLYIKDNAVDIYSRKGAAETNFFPGEKDGEFYIRGGKAATWLGTIRYQRNLLSLVTGNYEYTGNYLSFTTVNQDNRIAVEIYRRPSTSETFRIDYYTEENTLEHSETKPKETFTLTQKQDVEKDGISYVFVGFTTDYNKAGFLSLDDSANLYDYEDLAKLASIKSDVKAKYDLMGDCNPEADNLIDYDEVKEKVTPVTENGISVDVLKVYPVYAVRGYSAAVTANDRDASGRDRMIVGASDFKDLQNGATGATDSKERWLGSIHIEVYKDGALWVPGAGGSTTGRKLLSAPPAARKATLYFAYHNDNAADLNIKFIADSVTQDTLYAYMSSDQFTEAEPSEHYVIDAVYAEQGGSEDGLKYRLNWMDDIVGGQLDNVRGGSTVRIYVTTKYQVKYYLDSDDGRGYQLLTGETWTNPEYYTTPGTEKAVAAAEAGAEYVMTRDPATSYNMNLINRTPTNGNTFRDAKMIRGEYSQFLYKFETYPHTIPIARLPEASRNEIPAGSVLESPGNAGKWVIRDADLERILDYDQEADLGVTGTTYGTGNTVWSHKAEADDTNTYHLYAKVRTGVTVDIDLLKVDRQDTSKHLNKAVFELKQLDGTRNGANYQENGIQQTVTTEGTGREAGKAVFRGLPGGCYEIAEKSAPDGYILPQDPIFYLRVAGTEVTLIAREENTPPDQWKEGSSSMARITPAGEAEGAEAHVLLTVENTSRIVLPRTGGPGTAMYTLVGILLMAIAGAGLLAMHWKKREK